MTRALLVDYGGVLTTDLGAAFRDAEAASGLPSGALVKVLLSAYADTAGDGFVHRFERGELDEAAFEGELRASLDAAGTPMAEGSVLRHVFGGLRADPEGKMWDVVRRAREAGVRTGLLSNSWGTDGYPLDALHEVFDDLVISGEVGLRKPDPAIYRLAAERLDVAPEACAFVDDFPGNVAAAEALGMHGVLHAGDADRTAAALEPLLGITLR